MKTARKERVGSRPSPADAKAATTATDRDEKASGIDERLSFRGKDGVAHVRRETASTANSGRQLAPAAGRRWQLGTSSPPEGGGGGALHLA